jgi:quercetin dioxygenase-like cupin family protein
MRSPPAGGGWRTSDVTGITTGSGGHRRAVGRLAGLALMGALAACGSSSGSAASSAPTTTTATASGSPASKVTRTQLAQGTMTDPLNITAKAPSQLTILQVTIEPGGSAPWHTHPGAENTVVTAGQLTLTISTDPNCAPRTLSPGQAFDVPANTPHTARNDGTVTVQLMVTYLGTPPGATLIQPATKPAGCAA